MERINRVRKNQDFKTIISKRLVVKNDVYKIYYSINKLNLTRIGISVSSKVGIAVIRNKIKRQIRSMVNKIIDLKKSIDLVIIVKDEFKNNDYNKNLDSLKELINLIYEKEKII